jgi:small-conductance mechanosensitive channel
MEGWSEFLENLFNDDSVVINNLLLTLIAFLILLAIRQGVLRLAFQRTDDIKTRYNWRKSTGYILYFLLALFILPLWVRNGAGLTTYLGLLSAGIAIALKDPLTNLAGWVFIVWRHPLRVGDRIQIGDHAGDVIDVRIFQFSLMEIGNWVESDQSTGRIIHVPNGSIFTLPLANYTHGFNYIWNEIPVRITFESDWEKAKTILVEIAEKHSTEVEQMGSQKLKIDDEYLLFYKHMTPTVYTQVIDRGVELTIRYLCEPRQRRGTTQAIWEEVLRKFREHEEITFAYPTSRFVRDRGLPWQNDSQ